MHFFAGVCDHGQLLGLIACRSHRTLLTNHTTSVSGERGGSCCPVRVRGSYRSRLKPELTCFLRSHCCSRGQEDRMAPFSDADCEQHTSHVTIFLSVAQLMTRTSVAQVVSLACALHIPCVISMRSCCVFDSLRLLHFPLLRVYLLPYRLVFISDHQLHLPRCGGQIPCALLLMRTLAPYRVRPSH